MKTHQTTPEQFSLELADFHFDALFDHGQYGLLLSGTRISHAATGMLQTRSKETEEPNSNLKVYSETN